MRQRVPATGVFFLLLGQRAKCDPVHIGGEQKKAPEEPGLFVSRGKPRDNLASSRYGRQAAGSHLFCKPPPLAHAQLTEPALSVAVIVSVAPAMLALASLP